MLLRLYLYRFRFFKCSHPFICVKLYTVFQLFLLPAFFIYLSNLLQTMHLRGRLVFEDVFEVGYPEFWRLDFVF